MRKADAAIAFGRKEPFYLKPQTARMSIEFGLLTLAKVRNGYIETLEVPSDVGGHLKQCEQHAP